VYTCTKNDVISSLRKHIIALGLGFELADIRFRSNDRKEILLIVLVKAIYIRKIIKGVIARLTYQYHILNFSRNSRKNFLGKVASFSFLIF